MLDESRVDKVRLAAHFVPLTSLLLDYWLSFRAATSAFDGQTLAAAAASVLYQINFRRLRTRPSSPPFSPMQIPFRESILGR